jgi:hypothetical protein
VHLLEKTAGLVEQRVRLGAGGWAELLSERRQQQTGVQARVVSVEVIEIDPGDSHILPEGIGGLRTWTILDAR